eukprot:CAMPEP_0115840512 /NCGR_PEP_ID=MMETSP0287-20121206/6809_1 /TAXON_ID=412157 /ORGANISM="Chrysochromulina rotalis, Strain UIO044" /LENGTH=180 /DNA_ID=CAMNT_0003294125 /DNA_START=102 /DNA_END=645 /DNA_ORIENTATION=-
MDAALPMTGAPPCATVNLEDLARTALSSSLATQMPHGCLAVDTECASGMHAIAHQDIQASTVKLTRGVHKLCRHCMFGRGVLQPHVLVPSTPKWCCVRAARDACNPDSAFTGYTKIRSYTCCAYCHDTWTDELLRASPQSTPSTWFSRYPDDHWHHMFAPDPHHNHDYNRRPSPCAQSSA